MYCPRLASRVLGGAGVGPSSQLRSAPALLSGPQVRPPCPPSLVSSLAPPTSFPASSSFSFSSSLRSAVASRNLSSLRITTCPCPQIALQSLRRPRSDAKASEVRHILARSSTLFKFLIWSTPSMFSSVRRLCHVTVLIPIRLYRYLLTDRDPASLR